MAEDDALIRNEDDYQQPAPSSPSQGQGQSVPTEPSEPTLATEQGSTSPDRNVSPPLPPLPPPLVAGAYGIWPLDKEGKFIDPPDKNDAAKKYPNPSNSDAVEIYFGIRMDEVVQVPKEQQDLQIEISKILQIVKSLWLNEIGDNRSKFRIYYVRLFRLAQLGLEGPKVSPELAMVALKDLASELIALEAGKVKNSHLKRLGISAAKLSAPFLIMYFIVNLVTGNQFINQMERLSVDPSTFGNFMLLWIGCFIGVWLSYGIRTTTIVLNDLVITDADRLAPFTRLIFAGVFSMILGLLFLYGVVDVRIGEYSLTQISHNPIIAFLIGVFCGISELSLPASVGKRAGDFMEKVK